MKLSVVIPIYNAEKYIDRCLQSILRQDLDELEILCVDDGSTDNTYSILQWYQRQNSKIKVYRQSRQFAGSARNLGLSKASGEYIHFMDSDDYVYENVYSQIYNQAADNKLDCLKFRCFCFMASSGIQKEEEYVDYSLRSIPEKFFDGRLLNTEEDIDMMVRKFSHTPWSGIYRREFLIKNNITFNNLICVNDRSFYVAVITNAKRIALSKTVVVNHQVGRETSLVGIRTKNFECHYKSFHIIEKIVEDDSEKVKHAIVQGELLDTIDWYNNMPEYLKEKEKDRFNDFIDNIDMKYVNRYESDDIKKISREKKIELIREDVSGECYYRYSKLTSAGKRIEDILNKEELKEIYVYGVGEIGRMVLSDLSLSGSSRVKGIFDKRAANEKIVVEGYENVGIKTPEDIPRDNVPVVITPSRNYTGIIRELVDNGIEQSRIVLFNDLLKIVDEL